MDSSNPPEESNSDPPVPVPNRGTPGWTLLTWSPFFALAVVGTYFGLVAAYVNTPESISAMGLALGTLVSFLGAFAILFAMLGIADSLLVQRRAAQGEWAHTKRLIGGWVILAWLGLGSLATSRGVSSEAVWALAFVGAVGVVGAAAIAALRILGRSLRGGDDS